jgi:hypothetical protein
VRLRGGNRVTPRALRPHLKIHPSPLRAQALRKFIRQFSLPGWDASRAEEVQSNLRLLDEMAAYSDPVLMDFADREKARLSQAIAAAKEVTPPFQMTRTKALSKTARPSTNVPQPTPDVQSIDRLPYTPRVQSKSTPLWWEERVGAVQFPSC